MNFQDLISFLETKMRLAHIYQPLLIKSLIDSDCFSTLRQLAYAFLFQDESQLNYYEERIKQMSLKDRGKHGIPKLHDCYKILKHLFGNCNR